MDTEAIAEWVCARYPRRKYPAVFIGSSSGALAHLAVLAGVPWLLQTSWSPVRHRRLDPDEPVRAMNDHALPGPYARFLRENLAPGGTVVVIDCAERWPTTEIGPRQVFQHGAVGDAAPDEYTHAGPRVAAFLAEQGRPAPRVGPAGRRRGQPRGRVGLRRRDPA